MVDDAIRERHGLACRELGDNSPTEIIVWELDGHIAINGHCRSRYLTQWQARYLAAKLYRLSRRIRDREAKP